MIRPEPIIHVLSDETVVDGSFCNFCQMPFCHVSYIKKKGLTQNRLADGVEVRQARVVSGYVAQESRQSRVVVVNKIQTDGWRRWSRQVQFRLDTAVVL